MTEKEFKSIVFVVICPEREKWGRSTNFRAALRDAGYRGDMDEVPHGITVWLNIQGEEDRCTREKTSSGVFEKWEEAVQIGEFAMPFVEGDQVFYSGSLVKIW